MGTLNEANEFYNSIKKDKPMKWIFRIVFAVIAFAIILSVIFYIIDRYNNRHARLLWGLSEFTPEVKIDTIIPTINPLDFKIKKDSMIGNKKTTEITQLSYIKNNPVVINKSGKDTISKIISTVSGNSNNINNGVNNGIVGNIAIQNEYPFTENDKIGLLNIIAKVTDTIKVKPKCFIIGAIDNSSDLGAVQHISDFLNSLGYKMNGSLMQSVEPFYGVKVGLYQNCISIFVGNRK